MKGFIIAHRVLTQIRRDKRFLGFSIAVPFVIIFLIRLFFDSLPPDVSKTRYIIPLSAYVVHFLSYVLSTISLVQERTKKTIDRLFVSGVDKWDIITGYTMGYVVLGTLQSVITFFGTVILFNLNYSLGKILSFFAIIWILSTASVMLGILVSTFARNESQVIPFIPLMIIPTAFFSGLLIDFNLLPLWGKIIGYLLPFHYAVDALLELIRGYVNILNVWKAISMLILYVLFATIISSFTLKDFE